MSMSIEEVFKRGNPKIKDSSLKVYKGVINKYILDNFNILDEDEKAEIYTFQWVHNAEKVIENIEKSNKSDNTKRTFYTYIKAFLRGLGNQVETLEEWDLYDKEEVKYNNLVKEMREKNRKEKGIPLTDKQVGNLIKMDDIEVSLKTLTNEIKQIDNKENLSVEDNKKYSLYLILNTYLRKFPFRNELHNLYFLNKESQYKKIGGDITKNYLVKNGKEYRFVRNVYKTAGSKQSGGQKIDILPTELAKMFKTYLKLFNIKNYDEVFPNIKHSVDYTRLLTNYFKGATNKNVSSTILTKVINELSEDEKKFCEALKNLSKKRGTSTGSLINYYL